VSSENVNEGTRCPQCQLSYQCVCELLPHIEAPIHIALLMHENELERETNTGQWLLKSLNSSSCHIWKRTEPCHELLAMIESKAFAPYLLFPSDESVSISTVKQPALNADKTPLFIILDGTWQEAKKMLRKSPWLQALPQVHLTPGRVSTYQLRRNQQQGHLCTLEVCCELLTSMGKESAAEQLLHFFDHYMLAFKADKSGHAFEPKTGV